MQFERKPDFIKLLPDFATVGTVSTLHNFSGSKNQMFIVERPIQREGHVFNVCIICVVIYCFSVVLLRKISFKGHYDTNVSLTVLKGSFNNKLKLTS